MNDKVLTQYPDAVCGLFRSEDLKKGNQRVFMVKGRQGKSKIDLDWRRMHYEEGSLVRWRSTGGVVEIVEFKLEFETARIGYIVRDVDSRMTTFVAMDDLEDLAPLEALAEQAE